MIHFHTTPIKIVVCILGYGFKLHHLSLGISIPASLLVSNDQVIRRRRNNGGIGTNRAHATVTHTNTCAFQTLQPKPFWWVSASVERRWCQM